MQRVNKEIRRRTDVVGFFTNSATLLRLGHGSGGAERRMGSRNRRYVAEASIAALQTMDTTPAAAIEEEILLPKITAA